jgi:hypothetical protein
MFKCDFFVIFEFFANQNDIMKADSQKHPSAAGAFAVITEF